MLSKRNVDRRESTLSRRYVHIETWGCQMNTADSERILSLLEERGYWVTPEASRADLIVLNTCHIREKAYHKVVSRLGLLKELKQKNSDLVIVLAGCVAQAEGNQLLQKLPMVDVLVGPGRLEGFVQFLDEHKVSGKQVSALGFPRQPFDIPGSQRTSDQGAFDDPRPQNLESSNLSSVKKQVPDTSLNGRNSVSRFVNIQQGCNNHCTFCVVPRTRGREVSQPIEIICDRVKAFVASGVKEITLLGQNVNSYGIDLASKAQAADNLFVSLLERLVRINELQRLRFTTSNPHDLTQDLAKLFAKEKKLGEYFHLPVQSGSDKILKIMRRKVTRSEYLERVSWLKEASPEMAISTDLIVGFPGETLEDFEQTLTLMENIRFSFVYAFAYSPRKYTVATRLKDQVPEKEKYRRLGELNQLQNTITLELNQQELGRVREVLFLYESKKEGGVFYGRTQQFRLVRVKSVDSLVGQLLPVEIKNCNKVALEGILV